jgi:hypothetical protein
MDFPKRSAPRRSRSCGNPRDCVVAPTAIPTAYPAPSRWKTAVAHGSISCVHHTAFPPGRFSRSGSTGPRASAGRSPCRHSQDADELGARPGYFALRRCHGPLTDYPFPRTQARVSPRLSRFLLLRLACCGRAQPAHRYSGQNSRRVLVHKPHSARDSRIARMPLSIFWLPPPGHFG